MYICNYRHIAHINTVVLGIQIPHNIIIILNHKITPALLHPASNVLYNTIHNILLNVHCPFYVYTYFALYKCMLAY